MNIVVVIQARLGSSRLPGKVMMPLAGKPLLQRVYERVVSSRYVSTAVIATTENPEDDAIESFCIESGFPVFRGHETDLLDRHYRAALAHKADVCVKIPSDCPLIDPRVIDRVLNFYIAHHERFDFVSNLHPASYPDGQDVEVIPMHALQIAWKEASSPMHREHTTPFLWDQPRRFTVGNIAWETGMNFSLSHRWTIDYQADYEFIRTVYEELHRDDAPIFGIDDILILLDSKPQIAAINKQYAGVNWYRNHLHELRTVNASMTKQIEQLL